MGQRKGVAAARLRASSATCALYVRAGTTNLTVSEICASIGVPERTFYRYFSRKEDVLGPFFSWTVDEYLTHLREAPRHVCVRQVLTGAFEAALGGPKAPLVAALFPLVFADRDLWSVYLRHMHDAELELLPILASRLSGDADASASRAAAAAVASATRIAVEVMVDSGVSPSVTFDALLGAFETSLFPRSRLSGPSAIASLPGHEENEESP